MTTKERFEEKFGDSHNWKDEDNKNSLAHDILAFIASEKELVREEIEEKISNLRNYIILRAGPNDTEQTKLAELSLFAEIYALLHPQEQEEGN